MGVGVTHHLQAIKVNIIEAAVGETAQHDVVEAAGCADLITVYPWRIAYRLAHAGGPLLFKLPTGDDRNRLRRFNVRGSQFGRAAQ